MCSPETIRALTRPFQLFDRLQSQDLALTRVLSVSSTFPALSSTSHEYRDTLCAGGSIGFHGVSSIDSDPTVKFLRWS